MNHGKGRVAGQLTPVEHNRLTMPDNVVKGEPASGFLEKLLFRSLTSGHLVA